MEDTEENGSPYKKRIVSKSKFEIDEKFPGLKYVQVKVIRLNNFGSFRNRKHRVHR